VGRETYSWDEVTEAFEELGELLAAEGVTC
jgi:hypothetical protein